MSKELRSILGGDTATLSMRFGLHSGPVTAGVLRGEKSRFQLFGDTVNTAARMESTGRRHMAQLSQATADLLILAGKAHWLEERPDLVHAKGKGALQTYWLRPRAFNPSRDATKCKAMLDDVNARQAATSTTTTTTIMTTPATTTNTTTSTIGSNVCENDVSSPSMVEGDIVADQTITSSPILHLDKEDIPCNMASTNTEPTSTSSSSSSSSSSPIHCHVRDDIRPSSVVSEETLPQQDIKSTSIIRNPDDGYVSFSLPDEPLLGHQDETYLPDGNEPSCSSSNRAVEEGNHNNGVASVSATAGVSAPATVPTTVWSPSSSEMSSKTGPKEDFLNGSTRGKDDDAWSNPQSAHDLKERDIPEEI